jgi:hypothetical protein
MLLRHIARSLEVLYKSWLGLEEILGYNSLVPFWPTDLCLSFIESLQYFRLRRILNRSCGFPLLVVVWHFLENTKLPTYNSYLSSARFATKKTCSSFKFSIYQWF